MTGRLEPPDESAANKSATQEHYAGLRFGFSTLGCPDLTPAAIRALAAQFRSRFIEIRTLNGCLDFPGQLARFPGGAAGVRDFFLESDVRVRLVGSSFQLTRATVAERAGLLAEAEAGEALGAKWLRVFGGGDWGDTLDDAGAALAHAHRSWWRDVRAERGWNIDLLLETHDAFSSSPAILILFEKTGGPMPVLWDSHHTWRMAGESSAATWRHLGPHICHVHMKDSVGLASDKLPYTYVAPGHGEFPATGLLQLLQAAAFDGVVSLEWEKQWHPTLAPLAAILPDWNRIIAPFRRQSRSAGNPAPVLLLKCDFDQARIVPSAGPYFHGQRDQYDDIAFDNAPRPSAGLGEPTPDHPRLGNLRLFYEGGNASQRFARIVPDDANPQNRVLRFSLSEPNIVLQWPTGPQRKSRVQAELYGNIELRDCFQRVRLRLRPDAAKLRNYPAKITWFTLMEFWNHAGWTDEPFQFRFGLHLVKPDPAPGTDLFFATGAQHQVNAQTYCDVWHHVNPAFPVPYGQWLKLETYFKEGDAQNGRFYAAVISENNLRTILFDVRGPTHHPENPCPTGVKQFSPIKLYTSGELVDFMKSHGSALEIDWDDLELWHGRTPETG